MFHFQLLTITFVYDPQTFVSFVKSRYFKEKYPAEDSGVHASNKINARLTVSYY